MERNVYNELLLLSNRTAFFCLFFKTVVFIYLFIYYSLLSGALEQL